MKHNIKILLPSTNKKEIVYPYDKFTIERKEENIFLLRFSGDVSIEAKDIHDMMAAFREINKGVPYAVMVDTNVNFQTTDEARSLGASKEYDGHRIAVALVTRNIASKMLGNFFIRFNKPSTPTKLFTNFEDAMDWLKKHTNQRF